MRSTADIPPTDLLPIVVAVPGVRGIEPGITSTLRVLDARIRRSRQHQVRYGLMIEAAGEKVTVEIGLDHSRPVRETVRAVQLAVQEHLPQAEVTVRVQSLAG